MASNVFCYRTILITYKLLGKVPMTDPYSKRAGAATHFYGFCTMFLYVGSRESGALHMFCPIASISFDCWSCWVGHTMVLVQNTCTAPGSLHIHLFQPRLVTGQGGKWCNKTQVVSSGQKAGVVVLLLLLFLATLTLQQSSIFLAYFLVSLLKQRFNYPIIEQGNSMKN